MSSPILEALRQTSKGKLQYDRKWKKDKKISQEPCLNDPLSVTINSPNRMNSSIFSTSGVSFNIKEKQSPVSNQKDGFDLTDAEGCYRRRPNETQLPLFYKSEGNLNESLSKLSINSSFKMATKTFSSSTSLSEYVEEYLSLREKNRIKKIKDNVRKRFNQVREMVEELNADQEENDQLIRQNYLLISLQKSKQYREDFEKMVESVITKPSDFVKGANADSKLKKIEDAHKKQKEEEQKKLEVLQLQIRANSDRIRILIAGLVEHCAKNKVDLNHVKPIAQLISLANSVELILTKEKLTEEDVKESSRILEDSKKVLVTCTEVANKIVYTRAQNLTPNSPETIRKTESKEVDLTKKEQSKECILSNEICKDDSVGKFWLNSDLKEFVALQMFGMEFEQKIETFLVDNLMKDYRNLISQFIRTTVNAISSNSYEHLKDKILKLTNLLAGKTIEFRDEQINVKKHPLALDFAMHITAKTFLTVGLKQVISLSKSAYPLSAVLVVLWSKFPVFGKILLSQFQQKCPYLVPFYPLKSDASEAEFLVACGYSLKADGVTLEGEDSFLNKMRALVRLFGAIIQSNLNKHPYGLKMGWKWLATVLNMEPRVKITPAILYAFISTTHHKMYQAYKGQYIKLITFLYENYLPRIEKTYFKTDNKQSLIQLKTYIEKILNDMKENKNIEIPDGVIKNIPEVF